MFYEIPRYPTYSFLKEYLARVLWYQSLSDQHYGLSVTSSKSDGVRYETLLICFSFCPFQQIFKLGIIAEIQFILSDSKLQAPCMKVRKQQTRTIVEKNDFGRNVIVDKLEEGEFRLDERLPPLRKPVKRETIQVGLMLFFFQVVVDFAEVPAHDSILYQIPVFLIYVTELADQVA